MDITRRWRFDPQSGRFIREDGYEISRHSFEAAYGDYMKFIDRLMSMWELESKLDGMVKRHFGA